MPDETKIASTKSNAKRGRTPIYMEPLNERITTEFTKTMRSGIRKRCKDLDSSEAEYIRGMVMKDIGMEETL